MNSARNWLDIAVPCAALALGAAFWMAVPYQVAYEEHVFGVTGRTFPRISALVVLVAGALLLARTVFKPTAAPTDGSVGFRLQDLLRLLPYVAVMIAYIALLPMLGYLSVTVVALAALLLLSGTRHPITLLSVSLLVPVGIYFFFSKVMEVPLPTGLFM